jgi:acyl-CoA synthetase (AMP-forming)/AMP-acid ligase II
MTFNAAFEAQALASGDAPFIAYGGRTHSWAESWSIVARLAALLHARGVGVGDRVLLAAGNSPAYVHSWLAIRRCGATCVPVHGAATATTIQTVAADCRAVFAVTDAAGRDRVLGSGAFTDDQVLTFGSDLELEAMIHGLPQSDLVVEDHGTECTLMYTSGTTGPPKGVSLPNAALVQAGALLADVCAINRHDRIMICLPLYHANPQVYGCMVAIATGASIGLVPRFDAGTFFHEAKELRATAFTYVGAVLARLAKQPPLAGHGLRKAIGGGAPTWAWDMVEDKHGLEVLELYGMTETGAWVTCNRAGASVRGTCGQVRADMALDIVDSDDRSQPVGTVGEIVVRPTQPHVLFTGYHGRPELTLERFRNLWFHTGDLGTLDSEGRLVFHGRVDDSTVRRGGENISVQAVEAVIAASEDVEEVAVVGVPDDELGEELKAVVVPVPGASMTAELVLQMCEQTLPKFAWPRYVEIVDRLPKTETEKVVRAGLRELTELTRDLRPRS